MKNLHEIFPNFHLKADILKLHFYRKSFTDTLLMATIVISASNTTRNNNNINRKNMHKIYPDFHQRSDYLKPHFSRKSINVTALMATIVIRAPNNARSNNNINMKKLHAIYPDVHLRTNTLNRYF